MRPLLDAHSWLLESLSYAQELRVTIVELFRNDESESVTLGDHTIQGLYAVAPTPQSRKLTVRFSQIVAWQVVDESYTALDESEQRDDARFLHTLTRSAYLTYVRANHGWFTEAAGPAKHYRLWTEDEVVDVVALTAPVVEPYIE